MIRKLRYKFTLINMLFISTILLAVLCTLILSNYKKYRNESFSILQMAVDHAVNQPNEKNDFPFPRPIEQGRKPERDSAMRITPFFTVSLKPDQTIDIVKKREVTISDEVVNDLISTVMKTTSTSGTLREYSLRYLKAADENGFLLAFVDYSYEHTAMRTLIFNCLLIFIVSDLAFFVLSRYISKLAVNPVEQAWEQQNQFIADASHELKTPITIILANLGILAGHQDATIASQQKWLNNTKAEAERMKQLIEDLLFLAKSDSSTLPALYSQFDFSDTLWSCLLPFESIAFENKVRLENRISPNLSFYGNEGQLKQLIVILLDNACKYAGKNGQVEVLLSLDLQNRVCLQVSNTGETIAKEDLNHIFERFYRSDKSRVRKAGGYGLGLSIAKTITASHHGQISVTSDSTQGTVFTVVFPAQKGT